MSISHLKLDLINSITNTNDNELLNEIHKLIEFQSYNTVFEVDDKTRETIAISKKQIEQNDIIYNETVQSEINQWLKE